MNNYPEPDIPEDLRLIIDIENAISRISQTICGYSNEHWTVEERNAAIRSIHALDFILRAVRLRIISAHRQ